MTEVYYSILGFLAGMLVNPVMPQNHDDWKVVSPWVQEGSALVYRASSQEVIKECQRNPSRTFYGPVVIQGFHSLYVDGKLIHNTGDLDRGSDLYNNLVFPCSKIEGEELLWEVKTTTHAYAIIYNYPFTSSRFQVANFINKGLSVSMGGGILFIAFFFLLMFYSYFDRKILISMFFSGGLVGLFLILSNPSSFSIEMDPFILHRLHDSFLWIGLWFLWEYIRLITHGKPTSNRIHFVVLCIVLFVIWTAKDLDQAQVGSNLAFLSSLIKIFELLFQTIKKSFMTKTLDKNHLLQISSLLIFSLTAINDLGFIAGFIDSSPLFAIGYPFGFSIVCLVANAQIVEMQKERDHLAKNLEHEVQLKTHSLKERSDELEEALTELQTTQLELVQSSKLASVGTLAAGLAHEINNALNYPIGSISPLKRLLEKEKLEEKDRTKAIRIVDLMQDGLFLTSDIIKNLKSYSGHQSATIEVLTLKTVVENTLLLCRGHLKSEVQVDVAVDPALSIEASKAGLSQILMNLVNNASDAMLEADSAEKRIRIAAERHGELVAIEVKDTGPGIPKEYVDRVFDPFFTSKPEGKGTGLGLFIVNKELLALGGEIKVYSEEGNGTQFKILLPISQRQREEAA